ncbi:hypothetical protein [Nesterenkonia sp. CF4.4]|uniref:hypothetical protein n=1 Tax=Nesterenkonia sp. CF4.4 TaxID=3373079 RepID=UPI003EE51384
MTESDEFPGDLGLDGATESHLPNPFGTAAQLIPASSRDIEHIHMDLMYQRIADNTGPPRAFATRYLEDSVT